jgi:hypothetical protein
MTDIQQKELEWTKEDTNIVARYEQRVKEGSVKKFVIVPMDL